MPSWLKRVTNIEIYCLMENNQQQILSEIKSLMASVRLQLEQLDAKIAQWQQCIEPEEVIDMVSVMDLDLDGELSVSFDDMQSEVQQETPAEETPVEELPVEDLPSEETPTEDVQVEEISTEDIQVEDLPVEDVPAEDVDAEEALADDVAPEEAPMEDMPADDQDVVAEVIADDLPFFDTPEDTVFGQPEKKVVELPVQKSVERPAVIDVMTQKHAWRTAMAGAPVKDIRGAIALMDRVLFINTLFGTDPMAFQEALTQINQMHTLDEAVEYLASTHPEWDFDSEVVYSFMMAVRRKVNS